MKHFASQEDIVTMIHTYLQILQQYNIDLNLSYLRELSSSPMEEYSKLMFPCFPVLFPQTHGTYYKDSTLLMSTSSFNPSALPTSPAIPPHLVLLSSAAPTLLTPALAGGWLICAPGNLVLLLFFPPKSKENPRKLVLPLSYSKANKHPTPPANPNQASPKDPHLHLQVAATCGIRCWELRCSLFLLSTALAT